MKNLYVKGPRQRRALEALVKYESVSCCDMRAIVGALNPGQNIMELRRQGFSEIIKTTYFSIKDRDGKLCRVGRYSIPFEKKDAVITLLNEKTSQSVAAAREVKCNSYPTQMITKEG